MNIEGLLKAEVEDKKDGRSNFERKMDKIYAKTDFNYYRKLYDSDINKRKNY